MNSLWLLGLTVLAVFLCSACEKNTEIHDAGLTVSVSVTYDFWGSVTVVYTTKGVFTLIGHHSILIDKKAELRNYRFGPSRLCIEGWKKCRILAD